MKLQQFQDNFSPWHNSSWSKERILFQNIQALVMQNTDNEKHFTLHKEFIRLLNQESITLIT
jgi:hypothetical protein